MRVLQTGRYKEALMQNIGIITILNGNCPCLQVHAAFITGAERA